LQVGGSQIGAELAGERIRVGGGRLHDEPGPAVGKDRLPGLRIKLAEVLVCERPGDPVAPTLCDRFAEDRRECGEVLELVAHHRRGAAVLRRECRAGLDRRPEPRHHRRADQGGGILAEQALRETDEDDLPPFQGRAQVEAVGLPDHGANAAAHGVGPQLV